MRPPCSLKTHLHSVTGWLRLAPLGLPGDLESGQGTGAWALNIHVSAGRHTCSQFQTSASCQNSGDPSLWRAGNEANINNAAYRAPARSYLYLRSPSILRGCPSPQFLLGMFRSAQGTHSRGAAGCPPPISPSCWWCTATTLLLLCHWVWFLLSFHPNTVTSGLGHPWESLI